MIHLPEIWGIIQNRINRGRWVSIDEIYNIVEQYSKLDSEDYEPQSPTSDIPKWKRNIRNVLQYRKKTGEIKWNGEAHYLLFERK